MRLWLNFLYIFIRNYMHNGCLSTTRNKRSLRPMHLHISVREHLLKCAITQFAFGLLNNVIFLKGKSLQTKCTKINIKKTVHSVHKQILVLGTENYWNQNVLNFGQNLSPLTAGQWASSHYHMFGSERKRQADASHLYTRRIICLIVPAVD